jgi:membrane protease YdiL (CAAX protease family)
MSDTATNQSTHTARFTPFERAVSLFELILGIAIVVGHNVFKIVPNEVPILVGLAVLSLWLRDRGFAAIGWSWPVRWGRTLLWALGAAATIVLLDAFVLEPLAQSIWGVTPDISRFKSLEGNWRDAGMMLLLVWTFAAIGEELAYRGYLLTRAADLGARSPFAFALSLVLISAVFGVGHFYQGPSGVFATAIDGFVLGAAYLLSGRNFWVAILAHGFVDTYAVAYFFFGLG